jgi:hypothetical protein
MCNGIKQIKCTLMKCHTNVNSTRSTHLLHKFSYIVAILIHNHFEPPNIWAYFFNAEHTHSPYVQFKKTQINKL